MEDRELVCEEQPERRMIKNGGELIGVGDSRIGAFDHRRGGNIEIPHGAETQAPAVNKIHRTRNSEKEADVPRALGIAEYHARGNANGRILKGEEVYIAQCQDVSKMGGGPIEIKSCYGRLVGVQNRRAWGGNHR